MKTKNSSFGKAFLSKKRFALVEITIVLCSVFLVALPGIAAAASEIYEPGPLDVFGNANEDDTIDMRDTTYIKLVIFGKKPQTDLADANYDGKISMLDVGQTNLIILGKEKKLTFVDIFGEAVAINKPIKRLVGLDRYYPEVTLMLGAVEILVGVGGDAETFSQMPSYYPETIRKLPAFGYGPPYGPDYDYEAILRLEPDAIGTNILVPPAGIEGKRILEEKLLGIPIFSLNVRNPDTFSKNLRIFGYIIDREAEAEEFIDWYEGCRNEIKSRTEGLSEDEKPRVYYEGIKHWVSICPGGRGDQMIALAGGKNIADDIVGPDHLMYGSWGFDVDPEWVIEQNPDVIVKWLYPGKGYPICYETDDTSGVAALRQEILDRPELANVDAVKNKRVYVLDGYSCGGGAGNPVIGTTYLAKMFYPDIMKGIDPRAVHQEYLDRLQIDFNVYEHGVFVYPPVEEWPV